MAIVKTGSSGSEFRDIFQSTFLFDAATTTFSTTAEDTRFSQDTPVNSNPSKPSFAYHNVLSGSNFTYGADPNDGPTGGLIGAFYIHETASREPPPPPPPLTREDEYISNALFSIDARGAPLTIPSGFVFDSTDTFWRTMLSGEDTINLQLRSIPVLAGDGRDVAAGQVLTGAHDVFTLRYIEAAAAQGASLPLPEVFGDFRSVNAGATATGGDDAINWIVAAGDGSSIGAGNVSGDVKDVGSQFDDTHGGILFGGNDTINITGVATNGTVVVGDVFTVFGTSQVYGGNDDITGSAFDDTLFGDARGVVPTASVVGGNDTIFGLGGDDEIHGDANTDIVGGDDFLDGGTGKDTIFGGAGRDTLTGGADADKLYGEDDGDLFIIASAADQPFGEIIDGGAGVDILRFTSTTAGQTLALLASLTSVEIAEMADDAGSVYGHTSLNLDASQVGYGMEVDGNDGINVLTGTAFNDVLQGNAGQDKLLGGLGVDTIFGGDDGDLILVSAADAAAGETYDGGSGIDTMEFYGPGGLINLRDDIYDSIDHFRFTQAEGQSITVQLLSSEFNGVSDGGWYLSVVDGSQGADVLDILMGGSTTFDMSGIAFTNFDGAGDQVRITGTGDSDAITGTNGVDIIDGGAFGDGMIGLGGNDVYLVDNAADVVAESFGQGTDTVYASANWAMAPGQEIEVLAANAFGVDLAGNEFANTIIGSVGSDTLDGGANPEGPSGQGDVMLGGDGNDTYRVDSGLDLVDEGSYFPAYGFGGIDTIISTADFYWDVASVGETLQVSESVSDAGGDGVTIVGGVFDNLLLGHSGTDVMFGRGGSDTYRGGDGVDFISLSTLGVTDVGAYVADGNNTIIVDPRTTGAFSYDILFEFDPTKDKVDVSAYQQYASGVDVLTHVVDDGAGNSYAVLGDGLDYVYFVGLTKAELLASDFIV